jgi:Holliday junction resolvasome RuvABC endonuclease subunit
VFVRAPAEGRSGIRVLGIDPGLTRCGYGCIEASGSSSAPGRAISLGVLRTPAASPLPVGTGRLRAMPRATVNDELM